MLWSLPNKTPVDIFEPSFAWECYPIQKLSAAGTEAGCMAQIAAQHLGSCLCSSQRRDFLISISHAANFLQSHFVRHGRSPDRFNTRRGARLVPMGARARLRSRGNRSQSSWPPQHDHHPRASSGRRSRSGKSRSRTPRNSRRGRCDSPAGGGRVLASLPGDRWTIVTSCTRPLAEVRIRTAGISTPGRIITAQDIKIGKPDPEPYLKGAGLLGFAPHG